jgi:single-strand DNA-binding protein
MASYNRVVLVGNLTRDPELKYIPSGTAVAEIGLAVNDRRKGPNGEWIEETTFVDVTLWARTAEVASEYLSKGSSVLIEGRLKLDSWEKEGKKFSKLRVVGETMQMLGGRAGGGQAGGGGGGRARGQGGGSQSSGNQGGQESFNQDNFNQDSQYSSAPSGGGRSGRAPAPPDEDIPF